MKPFQRFAEIIDDAGIDIHVDSTDVLIAVIAQIHSKMGPTFDHVTHYNVASMWLDFAIDQLHDELHDNLHDGNDCTDIIADYAKTLTIVQTYMLQS